MRRAKNRHLQPGNARRLATPSVKHRVLWLLAVAGLSGGSLPQTYAQQSAWLGIYSYPMSPHELQSLQVSEPGRPVVTGVLPDSPGDRANLRAGDCLLAIDGQPVSTSEQAAQAVAKRSAGNDIAIVYSRDGARANATLRSTPAPANVNSQLFELASGGTAWAQYIIGSKYYNGDGTNADAKKARHWFGLAAESGVSMAQIALAEAYMTGEGGDQSAEHARRWYERAAEQGLLEAQIKLAKLADEGRGGSVDVTQAVRWYTAAAEQGSGDAHYRLGNMHFSGRGVAKDTRMAIGHLTKAAEAGHTGAMADLGNYYASGKHVPRDYAAAVRWLAPAAQAGNIAAQHDLGALYYYGNGVPRDHAATAQWLNLAASRGNVASQALLGTMYINTSPPDYQQALKWLTKAAENGSAQAASGLAMLYSTGNGVQKNPKKALAYHLQAAKQGDMNSRYQVGVLISNGTGVRSDQAVALKWLKKVADQQPDERDTLTQEVIGKAQLLMGVIYQTGAGNAPKDDGLAFHWIGKAAANKNLVAQREYGQMLRDQRRFTEAVPWLQEAATRGDFAAQNDLGVMYLNGTGVTQSRANAIAWLLKAHQQGSPTAKDSLRKLGIDAK